MSSRWSYSTLTHGVLACVLLAACGTSEGSGGATKGFQVIYAETPVTGAQVTINGQFRGTLTASYSNGSPGCFGPDGVSPPEGTVVTAVFLDQTYVIDIEYTNGTSDHAELVATQDLIDAFCWQIGTHPN